MSRQDVHNEMQQMFGTVNYEAFADEVRRVVGYVTSQAAA
jgi:hypothetical protein